VAVVVSLLGMAPAQAVQRPVAASTLTTSTLTVGTLHLVPCDLGVGAATWCGSLRVPLDPTDAAAGTIRIGFGWVPAPSPVGTVVAQEGGPGYPSTGTAPDFAAMLGPVLARRNLLVVDARGTGRSTPIDCAALQSLPSPPNPRAFATAVGACGAQLNHTFRRAGGGYVHASDLFTTANSARDLAAVITALRLGPVDLYGDSYGTYFAQSFLARYPHLLRSVVMDSAYEARGLDPWYRTTVTTARKAFAEVCVRSVACSRATGRQRARAWQRISALAALLRHHPVSGVTTRDDGTLGRVTVDVTALVNIVNDAGYDYEPYRQLDAAARAYLEHRDSGPLLRLYAQDVGYDYGDYSSPAQHYSDGLYLAVACTDYPQLFDMRTGEARRRAQLAAAVRALPAGTFAPFTTSEWIRVLPYTESFTGCLTWPAPTHRADPPVPVGVPMDATGVPVLILNGDLDSLTPAAGGAHIARQIGPAARAVVVPNMVHLVGLGDRYGCGESLVRSFISAPGALHRLDLSCLRSVPEIHAVGSYPYRADRALPASGRAPLWVRRLASIAVATAGDAAIRYGYIAGTTDRGLRGGSVRDDVSADGNTVTARLSGVKWTVDTRVSGTVTASADGLSVSARLIVTQAGHRPLRLSLRWSTTGPQTTATVLVGRTRLWTPAA
jgi:pimeloyl-ACP methyl ester carboxylesterase